MKALTLYPEHAELFRLGLRTIETRSWPAPKALIGERIAIHAGMRDPDSAAARRSPRSRAAMEAIPHGRPLTRGAVVLTVKLAECLPIIYDCGVDMEAPAHLCVSSGSLLHHRPESDPFPDRSTEADLDAEDRFGLFEPGRFGWVFTDPEPVDPPVPARGRQRLWRWEP